MVHSDDEGLVLPPRIAPVQVVIIPIYKGAESKPVVDGKALALAAELKAMGISVKYDDNDNNRPGWKFAEYELKGVPVRIAMGLRDIENGVAEVARRDTKEKQTLPMEGLAAAVAALLNDIQQNLYSRAQHHRDQHISQANSWEEFVQLLDEKGGFVSAHWDGTAETEETIKESAKATIRCIPFDNQQEAGACVLTGKPSTQRVLFARAY
jgi:prolyl-tRNA synthetase